MKHFIHALLALCFVVFASPYAKAQDDRLIIISPITGDKVQVALQDLGEMNWYDAKKACANLGSDWRLPTKEELEVMYKELHLKGKGNFAKNWYWSSTEKDVYFAWFVHFDDGGAIELFKNIKVRVRAVRALD
jgi:hypothetical protein